MRNFIYICRVLSRKFILSLVALLAVVICGESNWCDVATTSSSADICRNDFSIGDADILNSTSLLPGQSCSRSINSTLRRHFQRNHGRRLVECYSGLRAGLSCAQLSNFNYLVYTTPIGGVVSARAFYSLCSLRI